MEGTKKTGMMGDEAGEKECRTARLLAHFYMDNRQTLTGCISLEKEDISRRDEIIRNYRKQLSFVSLGNDSELEHYGKIACFGSLSVDMQHCIGFEVTIFPSAESECAVQKEAGSAEPCAEGGPCPDVCTAAGNRQNAAVSELSEECAGQNEKEACSQNADGEKATQNAEAAENLCAAAEEAAQNPNTIAGQDMIAEGAAIAEQSAQTTYSVSRSVPAGAQPAILPESSLGNFVSAAKKEAAEQRKKIRDEFHTKLYRLRALGLEEKEEKKDAE